MGQERGVRPRIFMLIRLNQVFVLFSLGVYFSLHDYVLSQRETLFLREGGKGTAANKYCGEISKIFKKNKATVMSFIREGHDKVHGMNSHSF